MRSIIKYLACCLVLAFAISAQVMAAEKDPHNPVPMEDDLIITGPENTSFVFRPVRVKSGSNPFSGVSFRMGETSGANDQCDAGKDSENEEASFKAWPTEVVVGGSFPDESSDGKVIGWVYYLGKYEVTEEQYHAVLNAANGPDAKSKAKPKPGIPVTRVSWYEAQHFLDALNSWLYKNAMDELPTSGPMPAFVRLPTEAEWEYAARGGGEVAVTVFNDTHPYGEKPDQYEWFSGTGPSDKIHPIGRLKPNPLGLFDMLGNVNELTASMYQVEYYQGRVGGFVTRGGHFRTSEENLKVSIREEQPFYLGTAAKGMRPNKKETMGFRLLLAAPIMTDSATIAKMSKAWESWIKSSEHGMTPAGTAAKPASVQEAGSVRQAVGIVQDLRADAKNSQNKELQRKLAEVEERLRKASDTRRKADQDSSRIWVRLADTTALSLLRNFKRLEIAEEQLKEAREADDQDYASKLQKRINERKRNIEDGLNSYAEAVQELDKLPSEIVLEAFAIRSVDLERKAKTAQKAGDGEDGAREALAMAEQIACLDLAKRHFIGFSATKKVDTASWRKDFTPQPEK